MRYILVSMLFALSVLFPAVQADQRFETVCGFCHFVTPDGFANGNDDAEVFYANCENSIEQLNDGTGEGSTLVEVRYSDGAEPFTESYSTSGSETGIDCVMVDSNGTTYTTQDWVSSYTVIPGKEKKDKDEDKHWYKYLTAIRFEVLLY